MAIFKKFIGYLLSLNLLLILSPVVSAEDNIEPQPQDSVPALLLFAKQQNIKPGAQLKAKKEGAVRELEMKLGKAPPVPPAKPAVAPSVVRARIASLEQRLEQQTKTITDLRHALAKAQSRPQSQKVITKVVTLAPSVTPTKPEVVVKAEPFVIDVHPLAAAWIALRQAIRPDPSLEQLQARLEAKQHELGEQKNVTDGLYRQLADEQQQQQKDALALVTQMETVAELQRENRTLQSQMRQQPEAVTLDTELEQQSYAAGVALGREIADLQKKNQQAGLVTDQQRLLAGINDTFAGGIKLSDAVLQKALQQLQTSESPLLNTPPAEPATAPVEPVKPIEKSSDKKKAEAANPSESQNEGERFMAEFSQDPVVNKDPMGFYYRIDYLGQGKINPQDRVDLVVTESLSSGKVIKDMESAGTVISQTLADYPPLFQAAIKRLEQHGSLTMVVPPALAYGDKGNPPAIPPNSTMVYVLRVSTVVPAGTE